MKCDRFTYETVAGMALYRNEDGEKVYRAKCTACGVAYDAVVHEGERAPRPREPATCKGVRVGARLVAPSSIPGRGGLFEVVGETRVSWLVRPVASSGAVVDFAHGDRKLAKDTLVERGNDGRGSSATPWRTEAQVGEDRERQDLCPFLLNTTTPEPTWLVRATAKQVGIDVVVRYDIRADGSGTIRVPRRLTNGII